MLQLAHFHGLLGRRCSHIRQHVPNLEIFVGLIKIKDLFAERVHFFLGRRLGNVVFYVDRPAALPLKPHDFGIDAAGR
ncbi:MAG TPA: hypothetical protein VKH64_17405, partial [Candidatus Binatia bacterium]|nr:hypothetical protein [Candidatus Binatia bacterium]